MKKLFITLIIILASILHFTPTDCKDTYGIKYSTDEASWTNSTTIRGALFYAYQ